MSDTYTGSGKKTGCIRITKSRKRQNIKNEHPAPPKKKKQAKRYLCIDLEMTDFTPAQRLLIPGACGEVIQFGAVLLDENCSLLSKFSSYVKPVYSSVTPVVQNLTGITNEQLENAEDFITVFDKFNYWRGEGDITTFCWSKTDHNQLWSELESKGRHRYDLFETLQNFVDLQQLFGSLLSSKSSISLESAVTLLQMDFKGQVHSALSDSYNTARILRKLLCTEGLQYELHYLNPSSVHAPNPYTKGKQAEKYNCSFASFMPADLLAKFGLNENTDTAVSEQIETVTNEKAKRILESEEDISVITNSSIADKTDCSVIQTLCRKYHIRLQNWLNLAEQVFGTEDMMAA
ncbi:MAG: exonuclease domain-containing protein [Treponema sp.]|uniref:3'-5' exonuclease n=1 Tax=Treponema sp. TaxID=166 RepID=UPI00298E15E9|nr:3'-5' exonuclease [Treponema sp.]MCQ2602119.1 exonuclease domain-containing protein [Treponema sp.]